MSRIGKQPVAVPDGVKVTIAGDEITVAGSKVTLKNKIHPSISVKLAEGKLIFSRSGEEKSVKALHGLARTLVANMIHGVTAGFKKELLITGIGNRAAKQGGKVVISIGYSHPVTVLPIPGVEIDVEGTNKLVVKGADKQKVGQAAANLRAIRPPDPYKGKGIRYADEVLKLKPGKAASKGATATK